MGAINTDTQLERVNLTTPDAPAKIKDACDTQGQEGRRLAAAFETQNQVVLIFQAASSDNDLARSKG